MTGLTPPGASSRSDKSTLHTRSRPEPTLASKMRPSFRFVNQSSITCTIGRNGAGKASRIIGAARVTTYHHCQLLCATVGNPASEGACGSQRIPSVVGGWFSVHDVFQKIGEKP